MPTTQKVVEIPKDLVGKVIGKGRATEKDIESDYGVELLFPKRDDNDSSPTCMITIIGDPDKIGYAEERILDICGLKARDEVDEIRDQLQQLRKEKDELFRRAYAAPHGPERDNLFNQANAAKKRCEQAEQDAARKIFESKNKGYGLDQMDLHGLNVDDAEVFVNERLDKVQGKFASGFVLSIITGIGNHSVGHVAKIRPAIMDLLRQRGFQFEEDQTGGILLVKGVTGQVPGSNYVPPPRPNGAPTQGAAQPHAEDVVADFFEQIFEFLACCFGGGSKSKGR